MRPITKVTVPQGVPMEGTDPVIYMPLFSLEEIAAMTPEVQLEKVRAFHCAYGQFDILEKIDADVEENGNPYRRKPLEEVLKETR